MRILIDADGCPVVDLTVRQARDNGIACIILCDTSHEIVREGAETVIISKGADSVDFAIVNMVKKGDIVVTQDYGLAAMCLARGSVPINQNGLVYTDSNIDALLMSRHVSKKVRSSGGRLKGPPKRTAEDDEAFLRALKRILSENSTAG